METSLKLFLTLSASSVPVHRADSSVVGGSDIRQGSFYTFSSHYLHRTPVSLCLPLHVFVLRLKWTLVHIAVSMYLPEGKWNRLLTCVCLCLCLQRWRTMSRRTALKCESTPVWRAWRTTCWETEADLRSLTPGSGTRSDTPVLCTCWRDHHTHTHAHIHTHIHDYL